jgi:hypothetical protein
MKHLLSSTAVIAGLALISLLAVQGHGQDDGGRGGADEAQVRQGFAIAPLPLNFAPRERNLVGLGSYIVNAQADCIGCHTNFPTYAKGGNPFLGQPKQIDVNLYLKGGKPFKAPYTGEAIKSRNLRLEANGLPAGLTLEEFVDVLRNGTDHDNPGRLLQVMPWPTFQDMTDRDLLAIYTYLTALPAP